MAEKEDQEELTVATDLVVTKYKMAAEMVNGQYVVYPRMLIFLMLCPFYPSKSYISWHLSKVKRGTGLCHM